MASICATPARRQPVDAFFACTRRTPAHAHVALPAAVLDGLRDGRAGVVRAGRTVQLERAVHHLVGRGGAAVMVYKRRTHRRATRLCRGTAHTPASAWQADPSHAALSGASSPLVSAAGTSCSRGVLGEPGTEECPRWPASAAAPVSTDSLADPGAPASRSAVRDRPSRHTAIARSAGGRGARRQPAASPPGASPPPATIRRSRSSSSCGESGAERGCSSPLSSTCRSDMVRVSDLRGVDEAVAGVLSAGLRMASAGR